MGWGNVRTFHWRGEEPGSVADSFRDLVSYFSSLVNTSATRKKLAQDMLAFVNKYGADGIDLDWEYPNSQVSLVSPWCSSLPPGFTTCAATSP